MHDELATAQRLADMDRRLRRRGPPLAPGLLAPGLVPGEVPAPRFGIDGAFSTGVTPSGPHSTAPAAGHATLSWLSTVTCSEATVN